MTIFSVTTQLSHANLATRVASEFPDNFGFSDRTWLISSELTPQEIAQKLGVSQRDSEGKIGSEFGHILVTQISANYWGFAASGMWEWMKSKFEKGS